MADRSVQETKLVLDAKLFEFCLRSGIHFCFFSPMGNIDGIYIFHKVNGLLFADMFIQSAAKIIGNIIFSIGKSACTAKTAHNGTGFTFDTAFYLISVNGTVTSGKRMAFFKNCDFQIRVSVDQLIGRKNTARTGTNNNHIIFQFAHTPYVFYRFNCLPIVSCKKKQVPFHGFITLFYPIIIWVLEQATGRKYGKTVFTKTAKCVTMHS